MLEVTYFLLPGHVSPNPAELLRSIDSTEACMPSTIVADSRGVMAFNHPDVTITSHEISHLAKANQALHHRNVDLACRPVLPRTSIFRRRIATRKVTTTILPVPGGAIENGTREA